LASLISLFMLVSSIATSFQQAFGHTPLLVRAPGRVNLIGEHTDYNDGFVVPAAIDKEIVFAIALNGTDTIRLISFDKDERYEVAVSDIKPDDTMWANYLKGVVAQLQQRGANVPGFDCVFGGNVPMGAGLSSSAAVECGLAFALNHLLGTGLDRMQLAHLAQAAEHTYAGVQCGIMDQFASLHGRPGQVVRLDCRSLEYDYFPFDTATCGIVLCNSGVKHSLASSEYNTRRQECQRGVEVLRDAFPEVKNLRDASLAQLAHCQTAMDETVYRRCRYVVEENLRVEEACRNLLADDLVGFGQQMYGSHAGLRDDYSVSCLELDKLVEFARPLPGVYGARMMGGGFGGCTINLVAVGEIDNFVRQMSTAYEREFGQPLETYQTTIVGGVEIVGDAKASAHQ
jgi:galactokinase